MSLSITNIGRLFTGNDRGVITDAAVVIEGQRITWIGPAAEIPTPAPGDHEIVDVDGGLVTPGLIDAHTHPVYAGDRLGEIALRSAGASYAEIAAAGGGIRATVEATRAASRTQLVALVERRLGRWLADGTTTVEAKTGYHLDRSGELMAVGLLAELAGRPDLPDSVITFLAAHDVPPDEMASDGAGPPSADGPPTHPEAGRPGPDPALDADLQASLVHEAGRIGAAPDLDASRAATLAPTGGQAVRYAIQAAKAAAWAPEAAAAGARFIDVFCDAGYFSVDQARQVLVAGQAAGLRPRLHADELARSGGSLLAAEIGAVSADHLLWADEDDARALAAAGVVATLCPVTALAMGRMPPTRLLAARGVTLALGSDHNPGQSGTTSMSLVVGLAVQVLGLSVDEALLAATRGGAASLAAIDRGTIQPGYRADLVLWDAAHEGAFAWELGLRPLRVWKGGQPVHPADRAKGPP